MKKQEGNEKVTAEQIEKFKKLQAIRREVRLREISKAKREELTEMALELITAGADRSQIAQVIAIREGLTTQEKRALKVILMEM